MNDTPNVKRGILINLIGGYFVITCLVVATGAALWEIFIGDGLPGAMIIKMIAGYIVGLIFAGKFFKTAHNLKEGDW